MDETKIKITMHFYKRYQYLLFAFFLLCIISSYGCALTPRITVEHINISNNKTQDIYSQSGDSVEDLLYNGNLSKAKEILSRDPESGFDSYDWYRLRGMLYERQNDFLKSLNSYENAVSESEKTGNNRQKKESYASIARLYYSNGDFENAARYFDLAVENGKDDFADPVLVEFIKKVKSIRPYLITVPEQGFGSIKIKTDPIPLAEISVNMSHPLTFLIDTGSEYNIISDKAAKKTGLTTISSNGRSLFSPSPTPWVPVDYTMVNNLKIDNISIDNVPFAIIDSKRLTYKLFGIFTMFKVDGIIGLPLLKQFVTTFDYYNKELILSTISAKKSVDTLSSIVPFYIIRDRIFLPIEINRNRYNFLLDTGATDSYLTSEGIETLNTASGVNRVILTADAATPLKTTIRKEYKVDITIGEFKLSPFSLSAIPINFEDPDLKKIKKDNLMKFDGMIGNDIFNKFITTFDFKNMQLIFERPYTQ